VNSEKDLRGGVRYWTPEEDALLGTMPDKKLARRLKRSYEAVAFRRLKEGIPFCNPKRKSWRPEDDQVLGTRPDDQIALLLRRTVAAIKLRRRKLGIRSKRAGLLRPWMKTGCLAPGQTLNWRANSDEAWSLSAIAVQNWGFKQLRWTRLGLHAN
jgi:hypothetical protein